MSDTQLLMEVAERDNLNSARKPLRRFDWIQQALEIFVTEGIDAVRITRLAEDLKVTRGSFYWHFANRDDLIEALLNFWKGKNSAAIIASVKASSSLEDGIFGFFEICIDDSQFDPRLDLAIREWSRRSTKVRQQIDIEDAARIEVLQQFFHRFNFQMTEALIRARVMYYSQIGFYALDVNESLSLRLSYTEAYFKCFTGLKPKQIALDRFRKQMLETYGAQTS